MDKNKSVIIKNLYIKEAQCIGRVIKLMIDNKEWKVDENKKLKTLDMRNGCTYELTVSFNRALAFMTEKCIKNMVLKIERSTYGRYD